MLSANREDYIKKVFQANESLTKLTNKDLAASLEVSAASSSEMMKKIVESGHVVKDKTLGFKLTETGREEASKLIRNHRLWEVFLVDNLGFSWSEVHEEAELLEHVTSSLLGDRLNEYLNRPKYCPHGSIIYGNDGHYSDLEAIKNLEIEDKAIVRKIDDNPKILSYLEERNIHIGDEFVVKEVGELEGSIILTFKDGNKSLSHLAASQIWVEVIS